MKSRLIRWFAMALGRRQIGEWEATFAEHRERARDLVGPLGDAAARRRGVPPFPLRQGNGAALPEQIGPHPASREGSLSPVLRLPGGSGRAVL